MAAAEARVETYDMDVVRGFALSALIWGIVGMAVGLLAAIQLAWPEWNWGPYLHFGRVRPVHTNAVIFGFTLGVVLRSSPAAIVGYFVVSLVMPGILVLLAEVRDCFLLSRGSTQLLLGACRFLDPQPAKPLGSQAQLHVIGEGAKASCDTQ